MRIGLLFRQITALSNSSGVFTCNTVINTKNETCKVVEIDFGVITEKGKAKIIKEDVIERKEGGIEKDDSSNQGDQEERGVTINQLIDKKYPWRRTKKHILNEPNPP